MSARPIASSALLLALCAGCSATGIHRKHDLRIHGGTNVPASDVVEGMTTDEGDNRTWGIEYIHSFGREKLGFEVGSFQSFTDGSGRNTLPGFGLGNAEVEKVMNDLHAGLNYPIPRFWGLESDFGLGLAYLDTSIKSDITGGANLNFEDQGAGAYLKFASMAPITDSFGLGLDLRYLAAFEDFEDTQQGVTVDADLSQWQLTLFLALTW